MNSSNRLDLPRPGKDIPAGPESLRSDPAASFSEKVDQLSHFRRCFKLYAPSASTSCWSMADLRDVQ